MQEVQVAIKASKEAGKILLKYYKKRNFFVRNKNARDIVTQADYESEKKIISMIKKYFPKHNILAEESGIEENNSKFLWIIDPLDGTSNFFKGQKDFCVCISLLKDKKILFGITYFPLTKEFFIARKGKGATKNGRPIKVSDETDISKMYAITHMTSKLEDRKLNIELYKKILLRLRNIHVLNACIARSLTDIAEGIADFQFRVGFHYWDYAAGIVLVQEAGGKATDLFGKSITLHSKNTLISNGKNHKRILDFINTV